MDTAAGPASPPEGGEPAVPLPMPPIVPVVAAPIAAVAASMAVPSDAGLPAARERAVPPVGAPVIPRGPGVAPPRDDPGGTRGLLRCLRGEPAWLRWPGASSSHEEEGRSYMERAMEIKKRKHCSPVGSLDSRTSSESSVKLAKKARIRQQGKASEIKPEHPRRWGASPE